MAALPRLMAKLGLDTSEFERGLDGSVRRVKGMEGTFSSAFSKLTGLGTAFAGGLVGGAVTAAVTALTSNIQETVKSIAAVGDEAKKSGLSLQAFQEWKYVAEQNRVGVDAMIDGFKELSLRADEWVTTGAGSAAESFQRLGFSAEDLKRRLKDPSELMLEIVRRLKSMDQAARIRIMDELFGGTGGEQFVQLIDKGDDGLRKLIARGHEVGAVLDAQMVQKAAEIDRRFDELSQRVSGFAKRLAVELADLPFDVVETRIDELFSDEKTGRSILGDAAYDKLRELGALTDDQRQNVDVLRASYAGLGDAAQAVSIELAAAASLADQLGDDALWEVLAQGSNDMRALAEQFANGTISGEEFAARMEAIRGKSAEALGALQGIDRQGFEGVIASLGGLGKKLSDLIGSARTLKAELPGATAEMTTGTGLTVEQIDLPGTESAPSSSPRPKAAPPMISENTEEPKKPAGGAKSNRKSAQDLIAEISQQTAALDAEAKALIEAAGAGDVYGDKAEYAATKARLLTAMQQEGIKITPELAARIDDVARAYGASADAADKARQKLEEMQAQSEAGRDAMAGLFGSITGGVPGVMRALSGLLLQIAQVQLMNGAMGLLGASGGGGITSVLGSLLTPSFDGGGYTGRGSRSGGIDGKGGFPAILHPDETVIDHTRGGSGGQGISMSASQLTLTDDGKIMAVVDARIVESGQALAASIPGRIQQYNQNPRRR